MAKKLYAVTLVRPKSGGEWEITTTMVAESGDEAMQLTLERMNQYNKQHNWVMEEVIIQRNWKGE